MSTPVMRGRTPSGIVFFPLVLGLVLLVLLGASLRAGAAPYAAMVMDARTGEVLHSRNADTRLHPASLTKMMTLYIAFEAVERGEIGLDDRVTISRKAAAEVPSKLGLRAGSRIELRYLIRAAAIKSANDAATAIGEAISGSEAAFARRMNRTARALGMTRTTFKNAHGLTEDGHLSTARDMTILGRRVFYDHPEYYNLFSRISTDAKLTTVYNTNRRFLNAYRGADGIKTGYTRAAGFNLVASAERGQERILATVFGGNSVATRNAEVARLLDLGFQRAPSYAQVRRPAPPNYAAVPEIQDERPARLVLAVAQSRRPAPRPAPAPSSDPLLLAAIDSEIAEALAAAPEAPAAEDPAAPEAVETALAVTETAEAEDLLAAALEAATGVVTEAPDDAQTEATDVAEAEPAEAETGPPVLALAGIGPRARPASTALADFAARAAESVRPRAVAFLRSDPAPEARPETAEDPEITLASADATVAAPGPESARPEVLIPHVSTSGGRHWSITLGRYPSRFAAERVLLKTALAEMGTLDGGLRRVAQNNGGFEATFVGLSEAQADLACRRLTARGTSCEAVSPG